MAEIKREKLDLESQKLTEKREKLDLENQKLAEREEQLTASVNAKLKRLEEASKQVADVEASLTALQSQLASDQISKDAFAKAITDSAQEVKKISSNTARDLAKPLDIAHEMELQGFNALVDGNFEAAQSAFQASENAVNGYHHSYELARLLRQRRDDLKDPVKKKEILQTIITKYYGYAPPEQIQKLREMAK